MLAEILGADDAVSVGLMLALMAALGTWFKLRSGDKTEARDARDAMSKDFRRQVSRVAADLVEAKHGLELRVASLEQADNAGKSGVMER